MGQSRRVFTPKFKQEAVKLLTVGGHPTAQVARDLEITPNLLRRWKQEVTGDPPPPSQARGGVLRQAVVMRCRAIRAHGGLVPVRRLCRLLAVSPWLLCRGDQA